MDAKRQKCIGITEPQLHKFERPAARFAHVHVDLVGPLPAAKGQTHLLTVIDRFTRWPEAIPLAQTDAALIGRAVALNWVTRFGGTVGHHIRQGPAVHVRDLASSRGIDGMQNSPHNVVSSPGERSRREISSVLKSSITGTANVDGMDGRVTLGYCSG